MQPGSGHRAGPGGARPPSPAGAFLGRVLGGDWAGAARAALWPVGGVLVAAVAVAVPAYGQRDGAELIDFGTRLRLALALLLQAVGGGFEVHGLEHPGHGVVLRLDGGSSLSLVPMTVTALWIAALLLGLRGLRARLPLRAPGPRSAAGSGTAGPAPRTAGLEAAVRVAAVVSGSTLALELCAQPTVLGVRFSSSPVFGALGALFLSLAVSTAVLHRGEAAWWLGSRPRIRTLLRATTTALRALGAVLALGSAAAYLALTQVDDLGRALNLPDTGASPELVALLVLPNLGVAALGIGWGAPVRATAGGSSTYGGGYESGYFGLAKLAEAAGPGAVTGAMALGLASALVVGTLAARRSKGRGERLLATGVFFALFLLLAALSGAGVQAQGTASAHGASGTGGATVALHLPDTLLAVLPWLIGAVIAGPWLAWWTGSPPPPRGPAPSRTTEQAPAAATIPSPAAPPDGAPRPRPRSPAVIWLASLAAALLLGSAVAAGAFLWQNQQAGAESTHSGPEARP
ncbi:zinc ribbon domain-containing protein [Streptomyces sp. TS71-3]|uniref:zinc ribbon domain-containing protein n=1 Tax=Streptomyces sp. TS71-3 TaxID=2733862 RepID=UPI001BB43486|nr:zinc ribbon domain-containing protein [Streptomyces sp. TS71-3]